MQPRPIAETFNPCLPSATVFMRTDFRRRAGATSAQKAARVSNVIVTCAVTGSIHTPSMSPYLPITPAQIAEAAVGAAEAGASIVHLHARSPADGRPSQDPELFAQFLPDIAAPVPTW